MEKVMKFCVAFAIIMSLSLAFYFYFYGEMQKACFWMLAAILNRYKIN